MRSGLRSRIKTVEVKVEQLTKDVAETRIMAAKNDEDLAPFRQEMRAHIRVVNALRQTQLEQGKMLEKHGKILAKLTATTDQHTAKLDQHTEQLGTLVAGQAKIMKHLGITEDDGDEPNGEP